MTVNSDIVVGVVLYLGLLAFYWWNEPHAREQDQKRQTQQHQDQQLQDLHVLWHTEYLPQKGQYQPYSEPRVKHPLTHK